MTMLGNLALGAVLAGVLVGPPAFAETRDALSGRMHEPAAMFFAGAEQMGAVRDQAIAAARNTFARLNQCADLGKTAR